MRRPSPVATALVLAAGKGTRLRPLTAATPKPMLMLHGKPILGHILDGLEAAGIREAYVVVGYLREQIEQYLRSRSQDALKCYSILQENVNGTGGATLLARGKIRRKFLLTYADILISYAAYNRLLSTAQAHPEAPHALLVNPVDDPSKGAAVYFAEDGVGVDKIIEKPPPGHSTTQWNNAGCYVLAPAIFKDIETTPLSPRGEVEITATLQRVLDRHESIASARLAPGEFWCDVGYPEIFAQLRSNSGWLARLRKA